MRTEEILVMDKSPNQPEKNPAQQADEVKEILSKGLEMEVSTPQAEESRNKKKLDNIVASECNETDACASPVFSPKNKMQPIGYQLDSQNQNKEPDSFDKPSLPG